MKLWELLLIGGAAYVALVMVREREWSNVAASCNAQFPAGWNSDPTLTSALSPQCPQSVAFQAKWGWLPVPRIGL
jgi:hypothetical protein